MESFSRNSRRGGLASSTRFTVLTGHLNQYSLTDVVGILRHQRKSGRLLIEYAPSPAVLYFKDGDLVDAEFSTLAGLQAVLVAFVQPPAAFNFNPLIQPTRFTIEVEQQRVIFELLGCWTEDPIAVNPQSFRPEVFRQEMHRPQLQSVDAELALPPGPDQNQTALPKAQEVLALPAGPAIAPRWSRQRWALALAVFALLLVFGVPTMIAISKKARQTPASATAPETTRISGNPSATSGVAVGEPTAGSKTAANGTGAKSERKHDREQPDRHPRNEANEPSSNSALTADKFASRPNESARSEASKSPLSATPKQSASAPQTVKVVMRIENGRVVQATIGDRRPNSEAYESLALRIARQRRYPPGVNKQETMLMKVDGPK
jgi:hypothetical protein